MAGESSSLAEMMTGERVVVAVVVSRVLLSLPLSLISHGFSLFLLSLSAFLIELRAETSPFLLSPFTPRRGASSGILLGAVTLPAVMMSKLVQLTRAISLHQAQQDELAHVTMQYWAASASCCAILIYLSVVMSQAKKNESSSSSSSSVWLTRVSLTGTVLYGAACFVSLSIISHTGLNTSLKMLWMLLHGVAAVKLIRHLLRTFPSCASIGEALLVTSGLVLYFGDFLACTIAKICEKLIPVDLVSISYGIRRTETGIIIQGLLLGLLLFPMVFRFALHIYESSLNKRDGRPRTCSDTAKSVLFFVSLLPFMVVAVPSWMQFVHDFHHHPFLWVLAFVFSEPMKRVSLCIYWLLLIVVSVSRFYNISRGSKVERILLRKYYHLMAVLMFLPALVLQPKFLDLAFGAALAVFIALEIIRIWRIHPLGEPLHHFMNAFTDHRDSELLIVSHFSLLLGCALPIWMSSGFNDRALSPFAGILSLGIGDTMASMVGHKYGVLRWSKTGKKTVEGTAAGITSMMAVCYVLIPVLASMGYILSQGWWSLLVAVTATGMLEAYTAQLDNAFIPLVFYSLLCL
ncbi:phosphatidate cytidylyltransferase family protein [Raphanus sativus]|uniref:Dolichol kinase EVAN n=1 Tax=Raphanus sativus TaxID=3726 RepID=A0A6J0JDI4_RAPSA|nr:dolichol kinase EVAN [Raphanus sativus]KAJ4891458.1 phosphatidate cytidylyltransferase family protein [Raphanus sativus]